MFLRTAHGGSSLRLAGLLTSAFPVLSYCPRALITTKQKDKVAYSLRWTPALFQMLEGLVWRSKI